MSRFCTGRKKRRAKRFDAESGTEDSRDEEPIDKTSALVQYQPQTQADFTQHLANILKEEPASPPSEAWGDGAPNVLSDVDTAFNSMNLAAPAMLNADGSGLSQMPQIPGTVRLERSLVQHRSAPDCSNSPQLSLHSLWRTRYDLNDQDDPSRVIPAKSALVPPFQASQD